MILLLGILASLVSQPHCQRINPIAGPFRIIPDHIEHCPAEVFKKELATWSFRGTRDRRNLDVWYYSGNYTLGFNFTDLYHVKLDFASWSSRGGWKDYALVLKFKRICATGKLYVPQVWQNIMESVFDEENKTRPDCPFPPEYTFV
ncbi:uncharacterized protein LOC113212138 isoform X3 [Frankliniella occidentalis]|uniref:Uncharacterized protein LOC113212138 isoform X3 n=1 Tax=Frankliniella occidentalis TaxID=133901 RepID=A0A9C6XQH4_FRAOC|nr:uncharacterized protein LOC113212138 isoform X3 [Frankliniella occidentalis]